MKNKTLAIVFGLFVVRLVFAQIPESPCPSVFTYQFEKKGWYGQIVVHNPPTGNITINAKLSIASSSPITNNVGSLSLVGSNDDIVQNIARGFPLLCRVNLPLQNPLATVKLITVNDQSICVGTDDIQTTFLFKTNIRLKITLFTPTLEVSIPQAYPTPSIPENSVYSTPDYVKYMSPKTHQTAIDFDTMRYQPTKKRSSTRSCGRRISSTTALVINGKQTTRGEWPWLVAFSVQRSGNIRFICGGTLISKFTVITAAHCLYDSDLRRKLLPAEAIVSMGRYEIQQYFETDSITRTAERLIMHEHFNYNSDTINDADIGLIIMRDGTSYNQFIQPVCLWMENSDLQRVVGLAGTVVGWGKDESGAQSSPTPKSIEIPIVSEATCLREDAVYNYITSNRTFCAGAKNGAGPCTGDSGSGFVMQRGDQWVIRGIVSTSIADPLRGCNEFKFVVFTDVTKYRYWIQRNTM